MAGILCHSDSAEGLKRTLEGLVCLEAYDLLLLLVKIACAV